MHAHGRPPGRKKRSESARPPKVLVVGGVVIAAIVGLFWFGMTRAPRTAVPNGVPGQPAAPTAPIQEGAVATEHLKVKVLATTPHDPEAYTQGLVLDGDRLFESTGLYGSSSLRQVERKTGKVLRKVEVTGTYFAEGLALVGDRLLQLTWREGKAFVYGAADFARRPDLGYIGEGWGLCYDGKRLVMSDGSSQLTFRDPETFAATGQVQVLLDGQPVNQLNELECVDGAIWSNVWQTDEILRIDPASGRVTAVVDATGLLNETERQKAEVLNGIAYDPARKSFLITGKLWPKMFEVQFVQP